MAADPTACSVATKPWLITPPRWWLITYFSAVTICSMLTVPALPPPGVSTSRIFAPGAIVCAYSTSSVVSLAQPTMPALCGLNAGTAPAGLMICSDGGRGARSGSSKAARALGVAGGPQAWRALEAGGADAVRGLRPGMEILVLTWLDRADREVLVARPRDDPRNPLTGVFSTRSPDRPNPIGLHRVPVIAVDGLRIQVDGLEALDGTPVIDVKPVLDRTAER